MLNLTLTSDNRLIDTTPPKQAEKTKHEANVKWIIRTVGAVIITALLALII